MKKITTLEMELVLKDYLNFRKNIVIPNVSWGMFGHECDLIRLTPNGYCSEIEIKISLADLKKDSKKHHNHIDTGSDQVRNPGNKIKYLYFAIPEYLENYKHHIPERAGILVCYERIQGFFGDKIVKEIKEVRPPKHQSNYKFSEKQRIRLLELMSMRIWNLKKKLSKLTEK